MPPSAAEGYAESPFVALRSFSEGEQSRAGLTKYRYLLRSESNPTRSYLGSTRGLPEAHQTAQLRGVALHGEGALQDVRRECLTHRSNGGAEVGETGGTSCRFIGVGRDQPTTRGPGDAVRAMRVLRAPGSGWRSV